MTEKEKIIYKLCEEILEVFREIITEKGETEDNDKHPLSISIFPKCGMISVFSIKNPATEENTKHEYYVDFDTYKKQREDAERKEK